MSNPEPPADDPMPGDDQARHGWIEGAPPGNLPPYSGGEFSDDLVLDAIVLEPFDFAPRSPQPTFHVPQRFGMSAIFGITTALALLFGLLRATNAHELVYLFFGVLAMVICLVQMRWGDVPRQASIVAGSVLSSLFVIALPVFVDRGPRWSDLFCALVASVPVGGFLGYLTGTCAGGVFLLMNLFDKYWAERAAGSRLDGSGQQG